MSEQTESADRVSDYWWQQRYYDAAYAAAPTPSLADVKRRFAPGSRWAVTNHYISREDHPAYGTTERTVTRTTTSRVYVQREGEEESPIDWPKASQVGVTGDVVTFYSHPKMPGEPFLTFEPR